MLEHLPHAVGAALKGVRPGLERTLYHGPDFAAVPATIRVTSDAFSDGDAIPERYTEDGEGLSLPVRWTGVPREAAALVLVIEDADSPTPSPLVHAIVWSLPGADCGLPAGALPSDAAPGDDAAMGKNSYLGAEYLPPDPPPGHGPHRYLVQVYALDRPLDFTDHPGRKALVEAMRGHLLAKGALLGTYERP